MVFAAISLLNGERSVVFVFVASVVFYLPSPLLYHGLALSILSLFAFLIEIRSESPNSLSQFQTRPGVPSGILLGAVTLPTVMLSKLMQVSRAFSSQEVGTEELESWTVQYWVSSITCLSLLLLLQILISRSENPRRPQYGYIREAKFGVAFLVFSAALCCLSLSAFSSSSFQIALLLFWILFHGLAAVKLIQHTLITFPACASIGEALLLTAGLILYFGDMLKRTILKINVIFSTLNLSFVHYGNNRSEISTIIQGMLLGLLLFPLVFKLLLSVWKFNIRTTLTESRKSQEICISLIFFSLLGFILIVIMPSWIMFVQDFNMHPLLWIFSFIFSEPFKNVSLCLYWVCVIYASVLRFYNISKNSKVERILLRKYYHLMAVLMFLPAVLFQPKFLHLSFGIALAVFVALEIIRIPSCILSLAPFILSYFIFGSTFQKFVVSDSQSGVWKIWPLGLPLHQFMNAFTDHRDSDVLIVSHFSLLLGCALPMWMSLGYTDRPLAPFAGILSLGIGDTMASVVGHKYGVLRWSKTGKKTIEGTAAGITSVLAACSFLLPLLASTGYIFTEHWFSLLLAIAISGLLEAYTAQLDNLFIPLVFYSLLCL